MCSQQQTKKRTGFNPKNKNYMFTATNIKKTGFKQKKFTALVKCKTLDCYKPRTMD